MHERKWRQAWPGKEGYRVKKRLMQHFLYCLIGMSTSGKGAGSIDLIFFRRDRLDKK